MSTSTPAANWTDTHDCPFCDETLANPGAAFVDHLKTSAECKAGHDAWRFHLAGDFGGA